MSQALANQHRAEWASADIAQRGTCPGPVIASAALTWLGQAEAVDSFGEVINPHILGSVSILIKLLGEPEAIQ